MVLKIPKGSEIFEMQFTFNNGAKLKLLSTDAGNSQYGIRIDRQSGTQEDFYIIRYNPPLE